MATYLIPTETPAIGLPLGTSRLGGAPDLPAGWKHPTDKNGLFYTFHAQLDLAELAPYQAYLPRTGMLYFFINDEEYARQPKVLYAPNAGELVRYVYPDDARLIDGDLDGFVRSPVPVWLINAPTIPGIYASNYNGAKRFPEAAGLWTREDADDRRLDHFDVAVQVLAEEFPQVPKHQSAFSQNTYHALNITSLPSTNRRSSRRRRASAGRLVTGRCCFA